MFIFGGCHGSYKCLNDLFMIDFESYLQNPEHTKLEWVEYESDQKCPIPRWGHSCISHMNNLYIIGGRNTIDFNDVYRYSLTENKWEKIMTEGELPTERRRQTVEVCGNQAILFGGFNGTYFNSMYYLNIPEEACDQVLHNSQTYKQKLFMKKRLFDVDFKVEGKILSAHKTVLYMTDPGFAKIFNETNGNPIIELKDVKYKYFNGIINYCYSKAFVSNSNLGYMLNIRFTAQNLGLSVIEKAVSETLYQRSKKSKPKKPKITFHFPQSKKVTKAVIFECPEEEVIEQIVDKISEDKSPNQLEHLWQKYTAITKL